MDKKKCYVRRRNRIRYALKQKADGKLRLTVHRSAKNVYAQIVDDALRVTKVAASTLDKSLKLKNGGNKDAAAAVGKLIGERAKKAGISEIVFDRGGFAYHGRIKALADSARETGLKF